MKEKELFERLLISNMIAKNSSLLFTVEQWELVRRLKYSGITKEQICQAFDDLDKMEKDLGQSNMQSFNLTPKLAHSSNMPTSTTNNNSTTTNSTAPNPFENTSAAAAGQIVNNYFASLIHPSDETKEVDEFKKKGEVAIQSEISFFVYKHDLKQSQISRMAGVNQAYVSKFLRGEFFEMSENGKILIYKWYLRFLKNPQIYLQAHNITLTTSSNQNQNKLEHSLKQLQQSQITPSFSNVTNTPYDVTKRTSFRFKADHLEILERAFIQNQYPDIKKREELARQCNLIRVGTDKDRVTEQIITHWFQNKRKSLRKYVQPGTKASRTNSSNSTSNNNQHGESNTQGNDNFDYPDFIDDTY